MGGQGKGEAGRGGRRQGQGSEAAQAAEALGRSPSQKNRRRLAEQWKGSATCFRKSARAAEAGCWAQRVSQRLKGGYFPAQSHVASDEKQLMMQLLME